MFRVNYYKLLEKAKEDFKTTKDLNKKQRILNRINYLRSKIK